MNKVHAESSDIIRIDEKDVAAFATSMPSAAKYL